jgi:hypothetical protein
MNRLSFLGAAAVCALLLVSGAQGKAPPAGTEICGVSGCVQLAFPDAERFWIRSHDAWRAPAPARFYVIRWRWTADGPVQSAYWIPAGAGVRWDYGEQGVTWADIDADTNKWLQHLTASIEPYSLPVPTRVTIGGRDVRAPQTYLRLFRGRQVYTWPATAWLQVKVEAAAPSPWTDGRSTFMLARSKPYVLVDHWVYRIPKELSAQAHRLVALRG